MPGRILYFGRNAAMMSLVGQQLSAAGMRAEGYMDEAILELELAKGDTKLLVIGGGVEDGPRARLKGLCAKQGILVLEHSEGPGSLPGNITNALG
jgi:hypothetical protein